MICIKPISNPFIRSHITSHSWHSFIHIIQKYAWLLNNHENRNRIHRTCRKNCLHLLFHTVHSSVQLHRTDEKMNEMVRMDEMENGRMQWMKGNLHFLFQHQIEHLCSVFEQRNTERSMHQPMFNMQNHFDGSRIATTTMTKKMNNWSTYWIIGFDSHKNKQKISRILVYALWYAWCAQMMTMMATSSGMAKAL